MRERRAQGAGQRQAVSCLFEDRIAGRSLRLLDPVARIAVHRRADLPAAWEAIEAARLAGRWVALLLDYELGEWLEPKLGGGMADGATAPMANAGAALEKSAVRTDASAASERLAARAGADAAPTRPAAWATASRPDAAGARARPRLTALVFARAEQADMPPRDAATADALPTSATVTAAASADRSAVASAFATAGRPVAADTPMAANRPPAAADAPAVTEPVGLARTGIHRTRHAQAIAAIRAGIARGDFYQINYTLPLHLDWPADLDPAQVYAQLADRHPVAHGACIRDGARWILSLSPELFVAREGSRLRTRPMKGTAPRHADPMRDRQSADELRHSAKNRAENLMIVDLLRNDLGRIATPGSVRVPELFTLEAYPSVWTLTSTIEAEAPDVPLADVLHALFPCGSVTGAPKIAAMQAIRQLEQRERGIYCGSVGWLAPNGDFSLNVAIRTIELRDGQAQLGVGGGIVYDSLADDEWQECLWKARMLRPKFTLAEPQGEPRAEQHAWPASEPHGGPRSGPQTGPRAEAESGAEPSRATPEEHQALKW